MRVLMVSKACVVGAYQKKLEELARLPEMDLTVVVPPYWRDERGVTYLERQHTSGYQLVVEPMALNGHFHLHFYPGLGKQLRRVQPDLVHIDEEPYNLATAHALWLARRVRGKEPLFLLAEPPSTLPLTLSPAGTLCTGPCGLWHRRQPGSGPGMAGQGLQRGTGRDPPVRCGPRAFCSGAQAGQVGALSLAMWDDW